jgi:hypothetical protein
MFFNSQLGYMSANSEVIKWVLLVAYASLDVSLYVLCKSLALGIQNFFIRYLALSWLLFLLVLSLWAGYSYVAALDSQHQNEFADSQLITLQKQIATQEELVDYWAKQVTKYPEGERRSRYTKTYERQVALLNDLNVKLESMHDKSTPPAQVAFKNIAPFLPDFISEESFKAAVRFSFSIAIVISPLLCSFVVTFRNKKPKKEQAPTRSIFVGLYRLAHSSILAKLERASVRPKQCAPVKTRVVFDLDRFNEVRKKVITGVVGCGSRDLRAQGLGSKLCKIYHERMVADGDLVLTGSGYVLAAKHKVKMAKSSNVVSLVTSSNN